MECMRNIVFGVFPDGIRDDDGRRVEWTPNALAGLNALHWIGVFVREMLSVSASSLREPICVLIGTLSYGDDVLVEPKIYLRHDADRKNDE